MSPYWGWSLGIAIALFGTLLTGLIIFFSLRTFREAIAEAKQAAEKAVSIWLAENVVKAIKPLENKLQTKGTAILNGIRQEGFETIQRIKALENETEWLLNLNRLSVGQGPSGKTLDPMDVLELQRRIKLIRQKPENQYTFDDWRSLFIEAENRKALGELNKYIVGMERIAKDDWQNASAKTDRAGLLSELQRYDEAIKLCDEIVDKYGTTDNPRLIERVANALCKKGWVLHKQGQPGAAIAIYDDVVSRYGERSEAGIAA
jgi:tetratricopeptide (TPR) repeat protein